MFKKPGPCKSTSQTSHCVSKYPIGELSWGMVREKTVCLRNQGHAKVPLRLAIVSVSTVKPRLSERQLSETTGLFEDDRQSLLFSL